MQLVLTFFLVIFTFSTSSKISEVDVGKERLHNHIILLKEYAKNNSYNSSIGFLVDMNIKNGRKRFFVVDLLKDSILISGLVTHGNSNNPLYTEDAIFSNQEGSYCSSEGKYKIGTKYSGRFGKAYHLYGLDKTNSNAFSRAVVLHALDCVPDEEVYPDYICNSLGCPTVSIKFLNKLSTYIDNSKKPMLLWIFK